MLQIPPEIQEFIDKKITETPLNCHYSSTFTHGDFGNFEKSVIKYMPQVNKMNALIKTLLAYVCFFLIHQTKKIKHTKKKTKKVEQKTKTGGLKTGETFCNLHV